MQIKTSQPVLLLPPSSPIRPLKMSVVRTKVLGLVDVIMRVPSLFIIDEILKIGMGVPIGQPAGQPANSSAINLDSPPVAAMLPDDDRGMQDSIEVYKFVSLAVLKFLICLFGKWVKDGYRSINYITLWSASAKEKSWSSSILPCIFLICCSNCSFCTVCYRTCAAVSLSLAASNRVSQPVCKEHANIIHTLIHTHTRTPATDATAGDRCLGSDVG